MEKKTMIEMLQDALVEAETIREIYSKLTPPEKLVEINMLCAIDVVEATINDAITYLTENEGM